MPVAGFVPVAFPHHGIIEAMRVDALSGGDSLQRFREPDDRVAVAVS